MIRRIEKNNFLSTLFRQYWFDNCISSFDKIMSINYINLQKYDIKIIDKIFMKENMEQFSSVPNTEIL